MKKGIIIGVSLVVLVGLVWGVSQYSTGEGERAQVSDITGNANSEFAESNTVFNSEDTVSINKQSSNFEFEGYTVGKSHVGTFDSWEGEVFMSDGEIVGVQGTIQADSVNTGIGGLDRHLKNDDFFDTTNINKENNEMTGNLLFRGVTKEITFPITTTEKSVSAEFFLDTTPFNFKYTGINKEVRIKFDFSS